MYILYPNIALETKEVFRAFKDQKKAYSKSGDGNRLSTLNWDSLLQLIDNDLESTAASLAPVIGSVLRTLRDIPGIISSFTGSGSAIFCLSEKEVFSEYQGEIVAMTAERFGCTLYHSHIV